MTEMVHFGVKGMKWGVRKDQAKKIALGVGTVAAIAGSVAVALVLQHQGSQSISSVNDSVSSSSDIASMVFNSEGKINDSFISPRGKMANDKVSDLIAKKYGHEPGTMPSQMSEQARAERRVLTGRMHSVYWSTR